MTLVDTKYRNVLEIEDTTDCSVFASYLDILLKLDFNGKLTTQPYDKGMLSISVFSIVNCPCLCSNFPSLPA
jgi:hypothetical protein